MADLLVRIALKAIDTGVPVQRDAVGVCVKGLVLIDWWHGRKILDTGNEKGSLCLNLHGAIWKLWEASYFDSSNTERRTHQLATWVLYDRGGYTIQLLEHQNSISLAEKRPVTKGSGSVQGQLCRVLEVKLCSVVVKDKERTG